MRFTMRKQSISLLAALLLLGLSASLSSAAVQSEIGLTGPGQNLTRVVLTPPSGGGGSVQALKDSITNNMRILPFVEMVDPRGIPGGGDVSSPTAQGIDFKRFLMAGANLLITTNWVSSNQVELRAFEVSEGKFIFGNRYDVGSGSEGAADVADRFCADFLENIIGKGDFFRSSMAFVKASGANKKDIWSVKPNGRHLQQLTNIRGEALSPAWSPDGRFVLFTSIEPRSHALGVYDAMSKSTQRIKFPGNTVIGPCFTPDNRVAVGLTDGRNPSIFILDRAFQKQGKLEASSGIDVSPSIDASGRLMAFTSNRSGGPQIYLKDLSSGSVRRVSMTGSYNTDPSISPDGTLVAYAKRTDAGHRIFVMDLRSGQEIQISNGPGSDEEPAFAPDGYFVAFMSTRSGAKRIYFTTRFGGTPTLLPTGAGDASFPAWGPTLRR